MDAVRPSRYFTILLLGAATAALVGAAAVSRPQPRQAETQSRPREFTVSARRYSFTPDRIEVGQDDLVKVRFTAEDIAHSFTIDAYRIAKRAGEEQTVTFEFRADRAGTFPYYCNLAIDDGCRKMRGELVVHPR